MKLFLKYVQCFIDCFVSGGVANMLHRVTSEPSCECLSAVTFVKFSTVSTKLTKFEPFFTSVECTRLLCVSTWEYKIK